MTEDFNIDDLKFDEKGLIPAVVIEAGTHKLLMVLVSEGSGSTRHAVTDVSRDHVVIRRLEAQTGTCDMAAWHILIELDADTALSKDLSVQFETENPVITETIRNTECADESGTNPTKETVTTANITW